MNSEQVDAVNLDGFDFFDGPPTERSPTWYDNFRVIPKAKKLLYASTAMTLLFSFVSLVLCCTAAASTNVQHIHGLIGAAIAMMIITFAAGCIQVVFYKEKDIIISI